MTGNLAQCVCPRGCDSLPKKRICGNNGQTYDNMCEMKQKSCQRKELVLKAYDGECGKGIFFTVVRITRGKTWFEFKFVSQRI